MSKILQEQLDSPIPRSAVSQRQGGGGRSLSYLSGHYVIDRLNKVFGSLGWASKTEKMELVHSGLVKDNYGKDSFSVHYIAQVRLVVEDSEGKKTEHTCHGYGDGSDKVNIGKAHELAVKEAETDALKRCAKNLGMSMGLALYDKDQPNVVEDDKKEEQPVARAPMVRVLSQREPDVQNVEISSIKPSVVVSEKPRVMSEINSYAKIINAKGIKTIAQLKEEMRAKYGHDDKEQLDEVQAVELRDSLKAQASA